MCNVIKTTKQDTKKLKRLLNNFNSMISFLKIDINNMKKEQFGEFAVELYPQRLKKITEADDFEKDFNLLRYSVSMVQSHLLRIMMDVSDVLNSDNKNELLKFQGTVKIVYDYEDEKYVNDFIPEGLPEIGKTLTPEMEQKILETKFFTIVSYLIQELPSCRFKTCKKCNLPFFQATKREKLYCSSSCANAEAQKKFAERKRIVI